MGIKKRRNIDNEGAYFELRVKCLNVVFDKQTIEDRTSSAAAPRRASFNAATCDQRYAREAPALCAAYRGK
eukprot:2375840-Pleurochrysis_carterae.AAC.4